MPRPLIVAEWQNYGQDLVVRLGNLQAIRIHGIATLGSEQRRRLIRSSAQRLHRWYDRRRLLCLLT